MTEKDGGSDNSAEPGDRLFRMVAGLALALGVGSGGYTISTTDDRVRKAEVDSALRLRDVQIEHLREQYGDLKKQVERIDINGPAVGNRDFERRIKRLEDKVK